MTKKENFIKMVDYLLEDWEDAQVDDFSYEKAMDYFSTLKAVKETVKVDITENGKNIILFMQKNESVTNNLFYAKDIAEGMFVSSRAVSGAMRKLVTDEYVEKLTENPIVYAITDKGRAISLG